MMWTPAVYPYKTKPEVGYGMGWVVREGGSDSVVGGKELPFYAAHSGGSVGGSSILVIMPAKKTTSTVNSALTRTSKIAANQNLNIQLCERNKCDICSSQMPPYGVVVAVLFNLQEVKEVTSLGVKIAEEFL